MNLSMIGLISALRKKYKDKPKAIFMAGPAGPASGKSFISKQLVPSDFKTINVDDTYEELLTSLRYWNEVS